MHCVLRNIKMIGLLLTECGQFQCLLTAKILMQVVAVFLSSKKKKKPLASNLTRNLQAPFVHRQSNGKIALVQTIKF